MIATKRGKITLVAGIALAVASGASGWVGAAEPAMDASLRQTGTRWDAGPIDSVSATHAILDRWEPIAQRAGAHSSSWREIHRTQLERMPTQWLRMFLQLHPDDTPRRAKASYNEFTRMFASAYASIVDDAINDPEKASLKLGSTANDRVFFPIAPCRIVDTRNAGAPFGGPIAHGSARSFYFYNPDDGNNSWDGQGGASGSSKAVCPGTVVTSQGGHARHCRPVGGDSYRHSRQRDRRGQLAHLGRIQ